MHSTNVLYMVTNMQPERQPGTEVSHNNGAADTNTLMQ
jgi:hypothetical protein